MLPNDSLAEDATSEARWIAGWAMNDRLLRRLEVERVTGLARSTLYRYIQEGRFPRPVRVGATAVRWRESDLMRWLESRPVAQGWGVQYGADA